MRFTQHEFKVLNYIMQNVKDSLEKIDEDNITTKNLTFSLNSYELKLFVDVHKKISKEVEKIRKFEDKNRAKILDNINKFEYELYYGEEE